MTATIKPDSPRYSDFVGTFDAETVQILPDRTREGNLKIAFDAFPDALQREIAAKAARHGTEDLHLDSRHLPAERLCAAGPRRRPADRRRTQRALRMTCYICDHNGTGPKPAIAICNELDEPVCREHAEFCVKEGHGTSSFSADAKRINAAIDKKDGIEAALESLTAMRNAARKAGFVA